MGSLTIQELWAAKIKADFIKESQQPCYWLPVNMDSPLAPSQAELDEILSPDDHGED